MTLAQATENIYTSLDNDNEDIDLHVGNLKSALASVGEKTVIIDPERLAQPNRSGRKMMQAYFKKRGVVVKFS